MTVFNSFFLLFKNDAAKSKKDVADLERQIDSLRSKGKARSAEETQQMKDAVKRHKELQNNTKETERATEKLADSIATAAAAYVSFGAIKAGIVNTAEFNRNISVQSKNLGIATQEMRQYSAAVEKAGGSQQGFLGFIDGKARSYNSAGLPFDLKKYVSGLQNMLAGKSLNEKNAILDAQGVNDPGARAELIAGTLMKSADAMKEYAKASAEADAAAEAYGASANKRDQAMKSFWGTVGKLVLPTMTDLNNSTAEFFSKTSGSDTASGGVFGGMVVGATLLSIKIPALIRGLLSMGSTATTTGGAVAGILGTLARMAGLVGLIVTEGAMIVGGIQDIRKGTRKSWIGQGANWVARQIDSDVYNPNASPSSPARSGDTGGDEMAFWMGKGLNREEASAIIGNRMRENPNMDINARGDGGAAHGYYQWQNNARNGYRRDKIKAATGIDVSTATGNSQHEAAWWEMNHGNTGFDLATFRSLQGTDAKAAYFSRTFERPGDAAGEAYRRGQAALGVYGGNSIGASGGGSGSSSSVKIDKIEVNTQATDAEGIASGIGDELGKVLDFGYGNIDDGVLA